MKEIQRRIERLEQSRKELRKVPRLIIVQEIYETPADARQVYVSKDAAVDAFRQQHPSGPGMIHNDIIIVMMDVGENPAAPCGYVLDFPIIDMKITGTGLG